MKINTLAENHALLNLAAGFEPFDVNSPLHRKCLAYLNNAMVLIRMKGLASSNCNTAFSKLPKGRSFDDVFNDDKIWISLVKLDGVMGQQAGDDIAVSMKAFSDAFKRKDGVDFIASILVHELAHVNGAPMTNMQAEDVLIPCGFGKHYHNRAHAETSK